MNGKIKWFDAKKGYGFITPADGTADVYVHITAFRHGTKPAQDDGVEFDIANGPKGPRAANVRLLEQTENLKR